MKWVGTNSKNSVETFELWNNDEKLAGISFSSKTRIGRLVSNFGKRLFFFERKGILTKRAVISNEYGIRLGKVEEDKPGARKGHLEFEGKKYCYVFNENNSGEINLYDAEMKKNLLSCSFISMITGLSKTKSLLDTKIPSLLLVLCWYAFQPDRVVYTESPVLN